MKIRKNHKYPKCIVYRLLTKVQIDYKTKCWNWLGAINKNGYGHIRYNNILLVHRVAYELFVKDIPNNLFILHKCDNKKCCNPSHLFIGNNADNMRDMAIKERSRNTILTASKVKTILKSSHPASYLAKKYGVSKSCIYGIKSRKNWKHIKISP